MLNFWDQDLKSYDNIGKISSILQITPIPARNGSCFLQVMAVQNAISSELVQHVWQPFCAAGPLLSSNPSRSSHDTVRLFQSVSDQLSSREGRTEAVWRSYTHWALDQLNQRKPELEEASSREKLASRLLNLLSPLARRTAEPRLLEQLESLVRQALELWKVAQKDRRRISVEWPGLASQDRAGWLAESDSALEDLDVPEEAQALTVELQAICHCTFPRIVSREGCDKKNNTVELYGGRVLWSDSKAIAFGLLAYNQVQEEWAKLKRQHETDLAKAARRMSTTISTSTVPFRNVDYS